MDCRALLAMTGAPRFVIANDVWRSTVEKYGGMDCRALLAMTGASPRFVIANDVWRSIVEKMRGHGLPRFARINGVLPDSS
jgi:CYTH domain-containing protein